MGRDARCVLPPADASIDVLSASTRSTPVWSGAASGPAPTPYTWNVRAGTDGPSASSATYAMRGNPRMALMIKQLERIDPAELAAIRATAEGHR